MDAARSLDLVHRCALPLLCTHGVETALLLRLARSFAHEPAVLRAASRACPEGAARTRGRSANTLLLAAVKARVSIRRLREVMSHAPDAAFSECNRAGDTPLSAACNDVRAGDAASLARALSLASSPHNRGEDWALVGQLYTVGVVVAQDESRAAVWYRKAADKGNAVAQYYLGAMYDQGRGVPHDDSQAAAWYRKAAQHGLAVAQVNLGVLYQTGRGVPQSDAQAVAWYRKSADQGNANAQSNLGGMYREGRGIPQDYVQAVAWYGKAAKQGLADAQCDLGSMYAYGLGVPKDYAQAVALWRKAAAQGDARAKICLLSFDKKGRG